MSYRDFEELLLMSKALRDALQLTRAELQHAEPDVSPLPSKSPGEMNMVLAEAHGVRPRDGALRLSGLKRRGGRYGARDEHGRSVWVMLAYSSFDRTHVGG